MKEVVMYSTGCPKCNVLKSKLDEKGVQFVVNSSTDEMVKLGITQVPMLKVDGELFGFKEAVEWVNRQ